MWTPSAVYLARGVSLNAAMAPFIDTSAVDIENMEGAAFFHVFTRKRFWQLRAISNVALPGGTIGTWPARCRH